MLLDLNEIHAIADALTQSGVERRDLVQSINPGYIGLLPRDNRPKAQFFNDINRMSMTERLADGEIPLQIYLQNGDFFAAGAPKQQKVIRFTLDLVIQRATGAPRLNLEMMPEAKEVIIHQDDMVPFIFMEAGLKAAASVMKVNIPAFEGGQPRNLDNGDRYLGYGTAWLLTTSLAITNHHVINARKKGEPDASEQDFRLQGNSVIGLLDYNAEEEVEPGKILGQSMEAWNKQLDYAIIRFPVLNREPLRFAARKLEFKKDPVAVNIIQHPGGKSKRYGIRNNLISGSTDTDLRYFTDTESGSSGSPVLNDGWEVVALHRGATYAPDAKFQGKSTAYLNVGTHLFSIFDDLRKNFPELAKEINI